MQLLDLVRENDNLTEYNKNEIIENINGFEYKKSNHLIYTGQFDFSEMQQNIFNYILSKTNDIYQETEDNNNIYYKLKIDILDLIKNFNYIDNNVSYNNIKECIKSLRDKSILISFIKDDKKVEETFSIFSHVKFLSRLDKENIYKKSCAILTFSDLGYKLLIENMKEYYTTYNFKTVLNLNGKYTKRIYEILFAQIYKSIKSKIIKSRYEFNIQIERFKKLMHIKAKYISIIERDILKLAQREINKNKGCNFSMYYLIDKKNKNITFVCEKNSVLLTDIKINNKKDEVVKQMNIKQQEQEKILDIQYERECEEIINIK